MSETFS